MPFSNESCFEAAGPHVIYEILDGEAVVINLDCGHYFGFDEIATCLWSSLISCRKTFSETLQDLRGRYTADEAVLTTAVQDFVVRLEQEGLIRASGTNSQAAGTGAAAPLSPSKPFTTPSFKKYTDMQDFLLVDPIHDVSESGWPERKNDAIQPLS